MGRKRSYGIVKWSVEDVIAAAEANDITMTEEQAEEWWEKNEQIFKNNIEEQGSEMLFYSMCHKTLL